MQAVLTVAGKSSRLYPFGGEHHKSTISLLGRPLIVHTLKALEEHGITDVVIIDSPGNGVREAVDAYSFSFPITFVTHVGARGMGEALLDGREKLHKQFLLVHAHHVDAGDILPNFISRSDDQNSILVKKESDLASYGAVMLDGDKVVSLEEKPKDSSKYTHKIVGMYMLNDIFIDELSKTKKNHYSFEDALSTLVTSHTVRAVETDQHVLSLKYPFHLFDIGKYLLDKTEKSMSDSAQIHGSVVIEGKVVMGENVQVMENAVIKGPCFFGDNVKIGTGAIVRTNVIIERDSVIGANMECKETIFFSHSSTHSGYLGNSIVGNNTKIAAQFTSGNVRLDRKPVKLIVKDREVDTGRNHLGVFIGSDTRIGIHVSTMPGIIIGNHSVIGPQTVVMQNVPDSSSFYSKIDGVIEKKKSSQDNIGHDVVLFDIDYTLFDTGRFKESDLTEFILYDEVIDVLQKLGQRVTLGIFSEGELDFQKAKLVNTMIHSHFSEEHIHIVSDKRSTIESLLTSYMNIPLILVDDKIEILETAKSLSQNVYTVWVKRGPFAKDSTSSFLPDAVVHNLDEIVAVIERRLT